MCHSNACFDFIQLIRQFSTSISLVLFLCSSFVAKKILNLHIVSHPELKLIIYIYILLFNPKNKKIKLLSFRQRQRFDRFIYFFLFFLSSWQVVIRGDRQVATFCYISENEQKQNLQIRDIYNDWHCLLIFSLLFFKIKILTNN
jgi:hypothetical protein